MPRAADAARPARTAYAARLARRVDPVIHERLRLGICSVLAAGGAQAFPDLRAALSATDGNLWVHLRVLEEAGYVGEAPLPGPPGTRARTAFRLTAKGRTAFRRYLELLEGLVRATGAPATR